MPSRNSSLSRLTIHATFAASILFFGSVLLLPARAQEQAKYANDTFTVIARTDSGSVKMHLEGKGDHCWATSSEDRSVGIGMGDALCTADEFGVPDSVALVARIAPNKILFRLNGKSYSIGDPGTVKSARSLFNPLLEIEAQQSEFGARQRALGEKQRELGRQQRDVKVSVPDMSADFQKVEADAKRLSSEGGTPSELGDLQSELGDLQSRIGDLQSKAGDAQSKLGDQQSDLGDQQSRLGDQQSELGDKAGEIAKTIADKLRGTLTQAINSGAARPE